MNGRETQAGKQTWANIERGGEGVENILPWMVHDARVVIVSIEKNK